MIFQEIKSALSMREVARQYGFEPNRANKISCPFHSDRTPSLHLYNDRFHCFGCGADGSVIDFTARLFDLTALDAAKKLNDNFSLGLQLDRAPPDPEAQRQRQREREAKRLFEEWKQQTLNRLDACIRVANLADFDSVSDAEAIAIQYKETFEYWADVLMHGSENDKMQIFNDRRIEDICRTVLQIRSCVA